jgi:photosystem II stability/assembly factor-like uncharacterized protein
MRKELVVRMHILAAFRIFWFCVIAVVVCVCLLTQPARAGGPLSDMTAPAIAVKMPDKIVLIAIAKAGNRLVAAGEHGVIIYSDDNGASWRQSAVPSSVTLTSLAFANAGIGWAAGHEGIILKTQDGGVTWTTQLNGNQVNRLTLAAAQAGVAANDPSPGTARAMVRAQHFLNGGPENPFLSTLATDQRTAFVFGAYRMAMKTTDGGRTWADWNLHIGDAISHNLYDAAMVGTDMFVAGEAGAIFRSTDGGQSFRPVTAPADATMFEVLATGDGGVFVCGVAGQAFRSADGGNTWQAVDLRTGSNITAAAVLASGALVLGNEAGGIYVSEDHAKTFTMLPEPEPMEIFGLAQAQNGDVVAVGNAGVIVLPAKTFLQS